MSAEPVEAAEYTALRAAVGWRSPTLDDVEAALQHSLAIATERDDSGALIGLARAVGDGIYVLIVDVIVAPHAQGQGLGRRLVERLIADETVAGAQHTALFAAPEVAPFYEQFGFRPQSGRYLRR